MNTFRSVMYHQVPYMYVEDSDSSGVEWWDVVGSDHNTNTRPLTLTVCVCEHTHTHTHSRWWAYTE